MVISGKEKDHLWKFGSDHRSNLFFAIRFHLNYFLGKKLANLEVHASSATRLPPLPHQDLALNITKQVCFASLKKSPAGSWAANSVDSQWKHSHSALSRAVLYRPKPVLAGISKELWISPHLWKLLSSTRNKNFISVMLIRAGEALNPAPEHMHTNIIKNNPQTNTPITFHRYLACCTY